MKILQVIPSLSARDGGPAKAAVEMCRELTRRGHDATIFTTNADGRARLDVPLQKLVQVNGANVKFFPIAVHNFFKVSPSIARALRAEIPRNDIVHIHSLYQFTSTIAAHLCRKAGIPYILRPHGTLDPFIFHRHRSRKWLYETLVERRNLRRAAAVHFTSREELMLAKSNGLDFNGVVVPLGVDLDPAAEKNAGLVEYTWPETTGRKLVLFFGRLNFKKGLDILIPAFAKVCRAHNAHLLLAGPDTDGYGFRVRAWIEEYRLRDRVTFTGMLTGNLKAAVLAESDLFVLPSYSENFGIAVVEAMGAGLPVIISNRVNIWLEIIEAGTGLVVQPDVQEVATAIVTLLDSPVLARQMGERGRRLVRDRFSWNSAGAKLLDLYRITLQNETAISA